MKATTRTAYERTERSVPLPKVIATSVIRSTYHGESHGGVYIVDLSTGGHELVIDWNDAGIDWAGRGGDRGLRGIAFQSDKVILAASDEIFVYSTDFHLLDSFSNPYLKHCHEIDVNGKDLYLTSCGFDSILQYDLRANRFVRGYCVRPHLHDRLLFRAAARLSRLRASEWLLPRPRLRIFDPNSPGGPVPADTCHINSVRAIDNAVYFSGRVLDRLHVIHAGGEDGSARLAEHASIPLSSHNAQPFHDGVLINDTKLNRVVLGDLSGGVRRTFAIHHYDAKELQNTHLATGTARQAFGRGLTVWQDRYVIAGSSPATVSVYDLHTGDTVTSVNLTMDVRNAIHGLEVWPF